MQNPQLSIIVPIYNTEKYLRQCLDSILCQTFTDFELILIDDGSTDNSAAICKEYIQKDKRIQYIYQNNSGVSCARNKGIAHAKGEWLYFVDADDELYKNTFEIFKALVSSNDIDMAIGNYTEKDINNKKCHISKISFCITMKRHEAMKLMFNDKYGYQGYIWNKVFRRSILLDRNIRFNPDIKYNEDRLFCVQYINNIQKSICFTSQMVYNYCKRETGAMKKAYNTFDNSIYSEFTSSLIILDTINTGHFSKQIRNMALDRIIYSYDMIRHIMNNVNYPLAKSAISKLRKQAINKTGLLFFIDNRIRRFISRQLSHILKRYIYCESYL